MGFFRRFFGTKKSSSPSKSDTVNKKRRWSFGKQRNKSLPPPTSALTHSEPATPLDANKHAIAVAAATAAVAEAALAAAHAAAEVVRLTSGGVAGSSRIAAHVRQARLPEETAAVKIQSAFRSYLARRALRALKALVKLQALVRGHIVRKQTADMLRRMQTLVRLQAQARATRVHSYLSDNVHSFNFSLSHYNPVPEAYDHPHRAYSTKFDQFSILKRCSSNANFRNIDTQEAQFGLTWLEHCMELDANYSLKRNAHHNDNDGKSDKILEVDTCKPHLINSVALCDESPSKRSTKSSMKFKKGKEEVTTSSSRTADNSPQAAALSSARTGNNNNGAWKGPFTPTRSECSWSFFPSYMANTESSRAKVRSQSAPRQRLDFNDRSSSSSCVGSTIKRPFHFKELWDVVGPNSDWDSDSRTKRSLSPASNHFNSTGSTYLR